ncbi:MAG TPA: hypothetical protein VHB77_16255, partial [Planctomycetaceae bacterium]|nr:hypothetical protein [Planctomycetaceae bacterium]
MSTEEFFQDVNDVERALRSLRPASPQLDRDRLMFLAGRASVVSAAPRNAARARPSIFWPSAAAAMTLVSLGLGATLALRPPVVIERVVQAPVVQQITSEKELPVPRPVESPAPIAEATPIRPDAVAAASPRGGAQYLRLRDQAIARGIEFVGALSPTGGAAGASSDDTESQQNLLDDL